MPRFHRTVDHFRLERVDMGDSVVFLVFDIVRRKLVEEVTDYLSQIAFDTLDAKTLEKRAYHVIRVYEFLRLNNLTLNSLSDRKMKQFARWELGKTKKDKSHRGSEPAAKRTVNTKLDDVLLWLGWLQSRRGALIPGLTLPPFLSESCSFSTNPRRVSPIYFKGAAEKSKGRTISLPPEDKLEMVERFALETPISQYAARRDNLVVRLVKQTGLRRESFNSLRTRQFSREDVEACVDEFSVTPEVQKFSYENDVKIPRQMALEICDFIALDRKSVV